MLFHLIFSWSGFLSWLFFIGDIGLIGFLTMKAYQDAEILDRCANPLYSFDIYPEGRTLTRPTDMKFPSLEE